MADFDGVREALDALKAGEVTPEEVRRQYGHVDGIERSISVALAQREQDMSDDEFRDSFSADFTLE